LNNQLLFGATCFGLRGHYAAHGQEYWQHFKQYFIQFSDCIKTWCAMETQHFCIACL